MAVNINDCRIEWYRYGMAGKALLRVIHIPTGAMIDRSAALRDDWKLDDALTEIDNRINRKE